MNGPGRFRRAVDQSAVTFHIAGDEIPKARARQERTQPRTARNSPVNTKPPAARRLTDQPQRAVRVNRYERSRRWYLKSALRPVRLEPRKQSSSVVNYFNYLHQFQKFNISHNFEYSAD